jgi:hypothetical protein
VILISRSTTFLLFPKDHFIHRPKFRDVYLLSIIMLLPLATAMPSKLIHGVSTSHAASAAAAAAAAAAAVGMLYEQPTQKITASAKRKLICEREFTK